MIYFIIFVVLVWVWLLSEWINAPHFDEYTNTKDDDSTVKSNDTNSESL